MAEPFVAPYGGIMTQSLEDEKEREAKLKDQQIEVTVNNTLETLRPESIFIRGVDNLSNDDIKAFIDYYLNFETVQDEENGFQYDPKPINDQITFRVQWINDSSVNIVFKSHEESAKALEAISITATNPNVPVAEVADTKEFTQEYISSIIQERETKPYSPTIQFQKKQNLLSRLAIGDEATPDGAPEEEKMDEDDSAVVLYARQSFQSDRKVKNAAAYSRYYLLHGEPERRPRYNDRRNNRGGRRDNNRRRNNRREEDEEEEDLFADKLRAEGGAPSRRRGRDRDDIEEDLFADKLRERQRDRSPVRNRSRSPMRD